MLAFDLPLISTTRPIVNLYGFTAMLDTGAGIPTFYMPVEIVLKLFGGKQIGRTQVKDASGQKNRPFVYSSLVELRKLFDAGIITEEEFTAKKKQILGI